MIKEKNIILSLDDIKILIKELESAKYYISESSDLYYNKGLSTAIDCIKNKFKI